uniref:Antitoxin n=1 Tax=uncultured Armatimonadetes bacterium TaxID=157466 RepID=A0A6J4J9U5_9BACT|nr:hypothetical protein AVDCRST_MAG63-2922 [uncultured Armatimonadetes bacterium]
MVQVTLEEAGAKLSQLIDEAGKGEEIVITRDNIAVAKLVSVPAEKPRPQFGSAKGLIHMAEDFDAPLDDFKDYM